MVIKNLVFKVHAGSDYQDFGLTGGLVDLGTEVGVAAYGLSQGRQLQFYGASHSLCCVAEQPIDNLKNLASAFVDFYTALREVVCPESPISKCY